MVLILARPLGGCYCGPRPTAHHRLGARSEPTPALRARRVTDEPQQAAIGQQRWRCPMKRFAWFPVSVFVLCICSLATLLGAPAATGADVPMSSAPDAAPWVTDGTVRAISTAADGTTYIGGQFTYVGPRTGGGAALDASSGACDTAFPLWTTRVCGGARRRRRLLHRRRLHRRSAASPATASPTSSPTARSTPPSTPTRTAGSAPSRSRARPSTPAARSPPSAGRPATTSPPSTRPPASPRRGTPTRTATSTPSPSRARPSTPAATSPPSAARPATASPPSTRPPASPPPGTPTPNNPVYALAVSGSTVYAGGDFTTIGGADPQPHRRPGREHRRCHRLGPRRGRATGLRPRRLGLDRLCRRQLHHHRRAEPQPHRRPRRDHRRRHRLEPRRGNAVFALAVSGSTVYAGGCFTTIGGQTRNHIAALDASSGAATAWNPDANGVRQRPRRLGLDRLRRRLLHLRRRRRPATASPPSTPAPAPPRPGTPTRDDPVVYALAVSGSTVYAGGDFTTIGGQTRNHIAALDATPAPPRPGTPTPTARSPPSPSRARPSTPAAPSPPSAARPATASPPSMPSTGLATAWDPNAGTDDPVSRPRRLGLDRLRRRRLHLHRRPDPRTASPPWMSSTGLATAWNPNAGEHSSVYALAVSGSTVYAGGTSPPSAARRRNGIAALDADERRRHGLEPQRRTQRASTPSPSRARPSTPADSSPPSAGRRGTASPPLMPPAVPPPLGTRGRTSLESPLSTPSPSRVLPSTPAAISPASVARAAAT